MDSMLFSLLIYCCVEQVPIDQDTSVAVESASALHLKPFEKGQEHISFI